MRIVIFTIKAQYLFLFHMEQKQDKHHERGVNMVILQTLLFMIFEPSKLKGNLHPRVFLFVPVSVGAGRSGSIKFFLTGRPIKVQNKPSFQTSSSYLKKGKTETDGKHE